jgi:outer membrane lipoprotein LolB
VSLRGILATGALLLLAGCVSPGPAPDAGDRLARALERFTLDGKVAWRHPEDSGRATLSWSQDAERFRLVLSGPLGRGAAVLEGDDAAVTLRDGDGVRTAASAEALLGSALGIPLPVAEARYWIRGVAAPGPVEVTARDEAGRPAAIRQGAWAVAWPRRSAVDGLALPARIELERPPLRLVIVAGRWRPGEVAWESAWESGPEEGRAES